ncbi:HAD family hydrolase [Aquamicrobium zhengzhouense]|uniref:phosphoglycolate phosphatase n=1 Tax=Aquamicrobium zhengzhouense TaxID=2781738 RepID=A0ABS0SH81_9HYPH|nr:HAD family hydrolase [Aquamicrobium zhengzhouense]MBI1622664.1 HAD family hydrolase [Aquamicrobium zhengzhouense]
MATIKGILFDKDGTLVDFHATWFAVADQLALRAAAGDRAKADALLDLVGYDFEARGFRPNSIFAAGTNAEIVAAWFPDTPDAARQDILADFDEFILRENMATPVELPGIKQTLHDLHSAGLRMAVATNDSTRSAERTLSALGIAQLFEAAYGYDAVAYPKPAPDTVQAFCDLTGLKPSQLAMVGDNRHDLEMAKAGGVGLAIGVLSGTGSRETLEPLADVILGSIAELPAYLAGRS